MLASGMTLDFKHMALTIRSYENLLSALRVLPKKQAKVQWRVDTASTPITVPPISTVCIPVCHKPLPPEVLLEFCPLVDSPTARSLAAAGDFHRLLTDHVAYGVLYTNCSTHPIVIPPHTPIGYI